MGEPMERCLPSFLFCSLRRACTFLLFTMSLGRSGTLACCSSSVISGVRMSSCSRDSGSAQRNNKKGHVWIYSERFIFRYIFYCIVQPPIKQLQFMYHKRKQCEKLFGTGWQVVPALCWKVRGVRVDALGPSFDWQSMTCYQHKHISWWKSFIETCAFLHIADDESHIFISTFWSPARVYELFKAPL